MKYGLGIGGNLSTSAIAVGQIGAWRLLNFDTFSTDESLAKQISDEAKEPFQPENQGFLVIEINIGMTFVLHFNVHVQYVVILAPSDIVMILCAIGGWTYLRANVDVGTSISTKVKFHLLGINHSCNLYNNL